MKPAPMFKCGHSCGVAASRQSAASHAVFADLLNARNDTDGPSVECDLILNGNRFLRQKEDPKLPSGIATRDQH